MSFYAYFDDELKESFKKAENMRALLLVDLQKDFCAGGALAVPKGDQVIPFANAMKKQFLERGNIIIATQDWHPANHKSFASNHEGKKVYDVVKLGGMDQVLWPNHCVQSDDGSRFHPEFDLHGVTVFRKGIDPEIDSYSGFFDNGHKRSTGLEDYLDNFGVNEVHVLGLATDYCVKYTCLDSIAAGFETHFYEAGSRAVNLRPGDEKQAIREMEEAGVHVK